MDIYKVLRNNIRSKIKKRKLYGADCNLLSRKIYAETQRQLSSSTLKRFFGLVKSDHEPSKYTLDTLAEFVGFKDWSHYKNSLDDFGRIQNTEDDAWDVLKKQMMVVTRHSLESLKQKTNYNKDEFIFRPLARDRFEQFEATRAPATLFIAPDGYGKSSFLIQVAENYFLQNDERFQDDMVCLIDGGIFFNLYSKNSNIDLLNQLLEFQIDSGINFYFQKNPEKRKGRIWLLFDDIDEVFFDRKRYYRLVENIMQMLMVNDGGWFKVVLTCRPENLDVFVHLFHKNPILKSYWFDLIFSYEKYIDAINIPPFSAAEIKTMLKLQNAEHQYRDIFTRYKDVLEIVAHPYLFSLFVREFKQNENISEIILLNRFIKTKIFSPPLPEEKLLLIKQYIKLCDRCRETTLVEKDLLLSDSDLVPAYHQLIADGIFYEYVIPTDSIDLKIMVSFTQRIILEYMVLRSWTHDRCCSAKLFFELVEYYKNNKLMQRSMVKLFLKMAMENKELDLIKQIQDQLHDYTLPSKGRTTAVSDSMLVVTSAINELLSSNDELRRYFTLE